jgi:PKD repeat protein
MYDTGWTVDLKAEAGGRSTPELPSIAAFSATVLADLHVGFADESADIHGATITGWLWDFDDGQTSALQNPNHLYTAGGLYTVRLTITNSFGTESSIEHDVTPSAPPLSTFTYVVADRTVTFTDTSTDPDDGIGAWDWDFGDGQISHTRHPVHVYAAAGVYVVTLKVWDVAGGQNLTTHNVTIVAIRRFPSAANWAFYFPTVPVPTSINGCQDAASPLVGVGSGGVNLIASGAVLFQQAGDSTGRYSVKATTQTAFFEAASNASFDVDVNTSISIFARAALPNPNLGAATLGVLGKGVGGGANTYDIYAGFAASPSISVSLGQQFVGVGGQSQSRTGNYADGTHHDFLTVLDRAGGPAIRLISDLGSVSKTGAVPTLTNTAKYRLCGIAPVTPSSPGMMVSYHAVWMNTALTQAHFNTICTPC